MQKLITDATDVGPVLDRDGDLEESFNNLENLLIELSQSKRRYNLTTKFLVLESRIDYKSNIPERYEVKVVRTLGYLFNFYKSWNCVPREGFNLERALLRQEVLNYGWQSQKDKQEAWGPWMFVARTRAATQTN